MSSESESEVLLRDKTRREPKVKRVALDKSASNNRIERCQSRLESTLMYPLSSPPRKSGKRGRNATEVVLPSTTYRFRFQRSSDQSDGVVEHSLAWDVSNSVEWNAIRLRLDADDGARLELFLLQEVIPLLRTKVQQQLEKENVRESPNACFDDKGSGEAHHHIVRPGNPTVAEQAPDTSAPVKKRKQHASRRSWQS